MESDDDLSVLYKINSIINRVDYRNVNLKDLREIGSLVNELSDAFRVTHGLQNEATDSNANIDFDYYLSWKNATDYPDELEIKLVVLEDKISVILCLNLFDNEDIQTLAELKMLIICSASSNNIPDLIQVVQLLFAYTLSKSKEVCKKKLDVMLDYHSKIMHELKSEKRLNIDLIFTLFNHFIHSLMSSLNLLPQPIIELFGIKLKVDCFKQEDVCSEVVAEIMDTMKIVSSQLLNGKFENVSILKEIVKENEDYKEVFVGKNNDINYCFFNLIKSVATEMFEEEVKKLGNNIQCLAKLYIWKRIRMDDEQFIEQLIDDYRLNEEKKQHHRECDLKLIEGVILAIDECIEGKTNLKATCVKIGENMQNITWNESDIKCIRNKHGRYNKHKTASNRENETGARINFEVLAYLGDLSVSTEEVCKVFTNQSAAAIQQNLDNLKIKLMYVITSPDEEKKTNEGKLELELLESISSYLHDVITLSKMKSYVTEYQSSIKSKQFSLDDALCRYHIGYILVQVGELSKQISRQLRGDQILNRVFKLLYKFRKEIKAHPNWFSELNKDEFLEYNLISDETLREKLFLKEQTNQLYDWKNRNKFNEMNANFNLISDKVVILIDTLLLNLKLNMLQSEVNAFEKENVVLLQDLLNIASKKVDFSIKLNPKTQIENRNLSPIEKLSKIAKTFCHFNPELLKLTLSLHNLLEARKVYCESNRTRNRQVIKKEDLEIERLSELFSMAMNENDDDSNKATFEEFLAKNKKEKPIDISTDKINESTNLTQFSNKFLFTLNQLELLKKIESLKESGKTFSTYASKMSLSIVGQCMKELFVDIKFKKYTMMAAKANEEFNGVLKETVSIRHSIMHAKNHETVSQRNKIEEWDNLIRSIIILHFPEKDIKQYLKLDLFQQMLFKIRSFYFATKFRKLIEYIEQSKTVQTFLNNDHVTGDFIQRKEIFIVYFTALFNLNEEQKLKELLLSCYNCYKIDVKKFLDIISTLPYVMSYFAENGIEEPFLIKVASRDKCYRDSDLDKFYEINEEIINECEQDNYFRQLAHSFERKVDYCIKKSSPDMTMECIRKIASYSSNNYPIFHLLARIKQIVQVHSFKLSMDGFIDQSKQYESVYKECCKLAKLRPQTIITSETISDTCQILLVKTGNEIETIGYLTNKYLKEIRGKLGECETHFRYYPEKLSDEIKESIAVLFEYILDFPKALSYYGTEFIFKAKTLRDCSHIYRFDSLLSDNSHFENEKTFSLLLQFAETYREYFFPISLSLTNAREMENIIKSLDELQSYIELKHKNRSKCFSIFNALMSGLKATLCYFITLHNKSTTFSETVFGLASSAIQCLIENSLIPTTTVDTDQTKWRFINTLFNIINQFYVQKLNIEYTVLVTLYRVACDYLKRVNRN